MTNEFKGFPGRPNLQGYVPVPNIFFDKVMENINSMSELKVLLAVFRKTYGWVKSIDPETGQPIYKLVDEISYSQFEEMTGLSSSSVSAGLNSAIRHGYLEKVQQGNFSGATSSYRVMTEFQAPVEAQEETPLKSTPQAPGIVRLDYGDIDKGRQIKLEGTPLQDFLTPSAKETSTGSTEKDSILDDIFGTPPVKVEASKEKKKTPHQRAISAWYGAYQGKLNMTYGNISGKEHGHLKSLIQEYGIESLVKAMDFYIGNYQQIPGVPQDYPTITVLYSWRKTLVPASVKGIIQQTSGPVNKAVREFDKGKWDNDDFFDN